MLSLLLAEKSTQLSAPAWVAISIALIGAVATVSIGLLNYVTQKAQAREQLALMREGQTTQRFTTAIEQLGSDKVDVRLGGIYALEGIARTDQYRREIIEVLCAYVQGHSPWPPISDPVNSLQPEAERGHLPLRSWAADVQTAMAAIARIKADKRGDTQDVVSINLTRVDLRAADLPRAQLNSALLRRSNLTRAILKGADLRDVDFSKATLDHADLRDVDLTGANLTDASMDHANVRGAQLCRARLHGAHLRGLLNHEAADFREAVTDGTTEWPENFDTSTRGIVPDPGRSR